MVYPLQGLKVLDISRVLAGPFAARILSDLGADVVKLEPPDGDVTRTWGAVIGGNPGYYHQQNVGKRNICIDLTQPGASALVVALAGVADVVVENFRPGVTKRLGIDYTTLSAANPRLVMLSISGFGQEGPEAQRAAYAAIIQAEAGLIARQARISKAAPADLAMNLSDTNAALHGIIAVLSALLLREQTGLGQHIDMAMLDATLYTDDSVHFALEDSEHTKILPNDVWQTAAGPLLVSGDFRHIWNRLKAVHGVSEPASADAPLAERIAARKAATAAFLASLPDRASVLAALDAMNLAWADVREQSTIREQPTVRHRGTITTVDDRAGGRRKVTQAPYRFSAAEAGVRGAAPWHGEHNEEVLRDWLGMDDAGIERWQRVLRRPAH
jgi:crotonobetainyl-CoA:carnitine CoA-transferase CaiB-like acyl-CoA transferase